MNLDDFVAEVLALAKRRGISARVVQVHRPSRSQTVEFVAPPVKPQRPLLSPQRDWRKVG